MAKQSPQQGNFPASLPRQIARPEDLFSDVQKRVKLVAKLRSRWPRDASKNQPPLSKNEALEIVREQSARYHQLCDEVGEINFLALITIRAMRTSDLMAPSANETPHLNEVSMAMAELIWRLNRPVLKNHNFGEDLEGLAMMDRMVLDHLGDSSIMEAVSWYYFEIVFGRVEDRGKLSEKEFILVHLSAHMFGIGVLSPGMPLLGCVMSYIHHLALPPLERRLRSYARTIASVESVLGQCLAKLRQERVAWQMEAKQDKKDGEKKERVIWIWNVRDHEVGRLAQEGYFEEAAAFQSESDTMAIYLISDVPNKELAGQWPCGVNVKVHAVSDHGLLVSGQVPMPDIVFMFHFDIGSPQQLYQLAQNVLWSVHEHRPITVLTLRCEAEAKKLKEVFGILGSQPAWLYTDSPAPVKEACVRNLWSGMAANPDAEYDDNGWVAAVFGSSTSRERLEYLTHTAEVFHHELWRYLDLCKQRLNWTEQLVQIVGVKDGMLAMMGNPKEGDEFTRSHLAVLQLILEKPELSMADLISAGMLAVVSPEEVAEAAAQAAAEAAEQEEALAFEEAREEEYRVAHSMVMVRAKPSTTSARVGMHSQGTVVLGTPVKVDGEKWLRIRHTRPGQSTSEEAWMLMDGTPLGLGTLLERVVPPPTEGSAAAKPQRNPVVFWGILDLKYDSGKIIDHQVKVLETGDGRLSRFSGCGASIKESFQQEHKLEAALRRAVITENKKLTHDVIVENGYAHLRPLQQEFRREYTTDLAERICEAFSLGEEDLCVLKLCNRARGAGVIPVRVADLDEVLQELLQPPVDIQAWFKWQPKDWARSVISGCFEEQVRHWWSNEAPFFLVEEFCMSMLTEKDERYFDGTMRVGFSLHREHRNKLPPGWVDSPDGPVRVDNLDGENENEPRPRPWNDHRPYLDLFRLDTSILRVKWLGGYWKLPIEDVTSQDLRGRIVSVAKQGTSPVPEFDLHAVYAALGDMVPQLFGNNDLRPNSIKERYKSFPELGSFIISRLACSVRGTDKPKSSQLLELARMLMEKEEGPCKDFVASYIHRNLGVAEAMQKTQWESAAEHFRKSIQKLPTNANSRHLLGLYYLETGHPMKAIETLEESLFLDPDFKAPYACLGAARLQLAQYQQAEEVSRAGLLRHPYTPACQYNLGVACFAQAVLQEHAEPKGYIASELRAKALEALETARDQRFKDQSWEPRDEIMLSQLRDERRPLAWSERKLPQDGWKVMGWRP